MRVSLVHDYLNQMGGAEKVVEVLRRAFPDAPLFTSAYLPEKVSPSFRQGIVRTSFLQHAPLMDRLFKAYVLLYPAAFASISLPACDVVLSSSSAFAKGVRVPPGALHICYCYTPTRFLWEFDEYVRREEFSPAVKAALPLLLAPLRSWDARAVARVDHMIAISRHVREKIRRFYGRESEVIYPPVDVDRYALSRESDDYFLVVSRLNAYKRIDLAVEAFNRLGLPLRIVGSGTFGEALRRMAGPNVRFLGSVGDEELARQYARCRALIFPGCEDFGLVPVEVNACGKPVIAYGAGGALETVEEGVSGVLFPEQTPEALVEAVRRFERMSFDPDRIRASAERFRTSVFLEKITRFVREKVGERSGR